MTTPSAPNAPKDSSRNIDAIGDEHVGTSIDTPMRHDAFEMSDDDKVKAIEQKFRDIMDIMGLDLTDDSLSGTPHRVAKMYVKEIFAGLNPKNHPDVKTFDNVYGYDHMLVERNITLNSTCEHHFLPIVGVAHVAYLPEGQVVGLSKLNRIVEHYARRGAIQENLTVRIHDAVHKIVPDNKGVAVMIEAAHNCVKCRGIGHQGTAMKTSKLTGEFIESTKTRNEFYDFIRS